LTITPVLRILSCHLLLSSPLPRRTRQGHFYSSASASI
jgi:hypothetical protein